MTPGKQITLAYKPRALFLPFHRRQKRMSLLVVHRRAGKTVAVLNDMVLRALMTHKPDGRYAYIAPFAGQAADVAWTYLKNAVSPFRETPGYKVNEGSKYVEIPNKCKDSKRAVSRITLKGAENAEALRGGYLDGVVLDEVGDMKRSVWTEIISPMLSDRRGWSVFIGTPKGHNFFWEQREAARKSPDVWYYLEAKASETGIVAEEELAYQRSIKDEDEYAQEYECSFEAAIKGSYFAKYIETMETEGRILDFGVDKFAPVDLAFDLGISDACSVWFYQVVKGQLRVLDHWEENGQDAKAVAQEIVRIAQDRGYRLGTWYLPHDAKARNFATGKSTIEVLGQAVGFDKVKIGPEHNFSDGISAVRKVLNWDTYFHKTRCDYGLNALRSYTKKWDPDRKVFSNAPRHDGSSHAADAFRYLACAVQETELETSSKTKAKPKTDVQTKEEYEHTARVNIEVPVLLTLDELFDAREAWLAAEADY